MLTRKERDLRTHDLQIPLHVSRTSQTRQLRFVVITPSRVTEENRGNICTHLERLVSLTGGVNIAIVLHLNPAQNSRASADQKAPTIPGLYRLSELQRMLLTHPTLSALSILPLTAAAKLPQLLTTYVEGRMEAASKSMLPMPNTTDMLRLCSTSPPLPQDVVFVLTDLFGDLRELAMVCTSDSPEAQDKLNTMAYLIGQSRVQGIVNFWKEEWVDENAGCY